MRFIIVIAMSISFFCQNQASTISKDTLKISKDTLKKKKFEVFLRESHQVNIHNVFNQDYGYSQELRLFYGSARICGLQGHLDLAKPAFDSYLKSNYPLLVPKEHANLKEKEAAAALCRKIVASSAAIGYQDPRALTPFVATSDDSLDSFCETHDSSGFPTNAYFSQIVKDLNAKEASLAKVPRRPLWF